MEFKYKDINNYLNSFINYETKNFFPYKKTLKLERVRYLLDVLKVPYNNLKVIHIAGTKGKGSVANFVSYILANSGYNVGVYTSPHFHDFRERIKVVKKNFCEFIPKKEVIKIVKEFKPYLDKLRYTKRWGKISFFEVYTAIALKYFCQENLDFVVLEVG
ncbi:MAG: bifunctional folylpolyglutamate synthase/dihydrofolate synthase, partial [Candidatus Omnitrophica bacterium]|nr:bifunctional folylpolyglutamate synthase/dihydrofolate synthase [Candidatus Omnitrophota bacterium]